MLGCQTNHASMYRDAIEIVLVGGSSNRRDFPALPRCPSRLGEGRSIVMAAAALASMLDDRHGEWFLAGCSLQAAIAKCRDERIPFPDEVKLGLRGMAMQADFAAGLMKVGGLS